MILLSKKEILADITEYNVDYEKYDLIAVTQSFNNISSTSFIVVDYPGIYQINTKPQGYITYDETYLLKSGGDNHFFNHITNMVSSDLRSKIIESNISSEINMSFTPEKEDIIILSYRLSYENSLIITSKLDYNDTIKLINGISVNIKGNKLELSGEVYIVGIYAF